MTGRREAQNGTPRSTELLTFVSVRLPTLDGYPNLVKQRLFTSPGSSLLTIELN